MTDNLNLACAFKLDRSRADMGECFGYSITQREWVITKSTGQPGEVTWEVAGGIDLAHFAPPPNEWYRPTSEGWKQTDVCELVQRLALSNLDGLIPTFAMRESLRDQLRQDPTGIWFLCAYTVASTKMFLTEETREWVQHSDGQWSIPDQWPAPNTSGWELCDDVSWKPANVFTVIEHLANCVIVLPD